MGLEWSLRKLDVATGQALKPGLEGRWDPYSMDELLTGHDEGPVMRLIASGVTGCVHDAKTDFSLHECPPAVIPPDSVRQCHAEIARWIRVPEPIDGSERVQRMRDYPPAERREMYDSLGEFIAEFQRFINEAAANGYALICEMH